MAASASSNDQVLSEKNIFGTLIVKSWVSWCALVLDCTDIKSLAYTSGLNHAAKKFSGYRYILKRMSLVIVISENFVLKFTVHWHITLKNKYESHMYAKIAIYVAFQGLI